MLKILVTLVYFERPNIVKNALNSLKEMAYDNWELAFIDDGSVKYPGEPIVKEILKHYLGRIKFYNSGDSIEDKYRNNGSRHGLFMTQSVLDSDADINFVLCDDDAVTKNYLYNISEFFTKHPDKRWGYSHVIVFNPMLQVYNTTNQTPNEWLNRFITPINPACAIDSSQVVWRTDCIREGIYWNYPQTGALDANFFEKMYNKYGPCEFMNCIGQYKGIFPDQMGKRPAERILITNDTSF